ncbi:MAG: glutamate racemase [Bacteroidales bacterium]
MSDHRPVGVFDSGLGGLSVLLSLYGTLPDESFIYYADSAWCPYGSKSMAEVRERTFRITRFLMDKGAKAIVVACNTATAAAIDDLRASFPIPFIGIEPAIKQAALHTRSGKVGVLATRNTFQGRLFMETSARFANDKDLHIQPGDGLVEIVEEDRIATPEARQLLLSYITPMIEAGVDQIVLGCTHYPFLIPEIRAMVPDDVIIHDPSPAVARQTKHILEDNGLLNKASSHQDLFFTSGDTRMMEQMLIRLGMRSIHAKQVIL